MLRAMIWTLTLTLLAGSTAWAASRQEQADQYTKELDNSDAKIRAAAATELGKLGQVRATYTRAAIPKLMALLKDKDAKVRAAAAETLGMIDADASKLVPALLTIIKNDKEEINVRTAAIRSFSHMGEAAKPAMPTLRELSKDKEQRQLSGAARNTLRTLSGR